MGLIRKIKPLLYNMMMQLLHKGSAFCTYRLAVIWQISAWATQLTSATEHIRIPLCQSKIIHLITVSRFRKFKRVQVQ